MELTEDKSTIRNIVLGASPVIMCPYCRKQYDLRQDGDNEASMNEFTTVEAATPNTPELARHTCGKLVRFMSLGRTLCQSK